jgi:hypothetical protein
MGRIIIFAAIIFGVIYPHEPGDEWAILTAISFIFLGAYISRRKRISEQADALYIIFDKRKSLINLITRLTINLAFLSYWYFRMPGGPDNKIFYLVLYTAVVVAFLFEGGFRAQYRLYDDFISYKNRKLTYSKIIDIREDNSFYRIDSEIFLNHIKWKRELVSNEIAKFLNNKIKRCTTTTE